MPLVSVIIATYNGSKYISTAIDSVLSQTFSDAEIIVVDDGSKDATPEILADYGSEIRTIRQKNLGGVAARNRAYRSAEGDHIVILDHDDRLLPDHLAWLSESLEARDDIAVAYGDTYLINSDGHRVRLLSKTHPPASGWILDDLVYRNRLSVNAAMVRRECIEAAGGLHEEGLNYMADWDLWVRLSEKFPFYYLDKPVAELRFHSGMSRKSFADNTLLTEAIHTFERFMQMSSFSSLSKESRAECYWGYGYRLMLKGDPKRGKKFLRDAIRANPFHAKASLVLLSSLLGRLPVWTADRLKRWAFHSVSPLR